jgi:hypothetical protein
MSELAIVQLANSPQAVSEVRYLSYFLEKNRESSRHTQWRERTYMALLNRELSPEEAGLAIQESLLIGHPERDDQSNLNLIYWLLVSKEIRWGEFDPVVVAVTANAVLDMEFLLPVGS